MQPKYYSIWTVLDNLILTFLWMHHYLYGRTIGRNKQMENMSSQVFRYKKYTQIPYEIDNNKFCSRLRRRIDSIDATSKYSFQLESCASVFRTSFLLSLLMSCFPFTSSTSVVFYVVSPLPMLSEKFKDFSTSSVTISRRLDLESMFIDLRINHISIGIVWFNFIR